MRSSATDGRLGLAGGLVIETDGYVATALVVTEGHLWAKKRVTLPIARVRQFAEEITLGHVHGAGAHHRSSTSLTSRDRSRPRQTQRRGQPRSVSGLAPDATHLDAW